MKLYYTPPPQNIFDEVKIASIDLWTKMDATGKINSIKDVQNIRDNFMYMVAMFDIHNQLKLRNKLSKEAVEEISARIKDGGTPDEFNVFNIIKIE